MSKQLYEEALADVKKLKEIAEDNAKRAVVEAVAPRIRELIEKELLGEASKEHDIETTEPAEGLLHDVVPTSDKNEEYSEVVATFEVEEAAEENVDSNSANEISELANEIRKISNADNTLANFEKHIAYVNEMVSSLSGIQKQLKETKSYAQKVEQLSSMVEDLFEYVQDKITEPAQQLSCNLKIQNCLKKIEKLQEIKMKNKKGRLDEETVNLELTGLPDDIDLESLGVNLVSGGDEEEAGEEGGDEELDLGGDEEEAGEEDAEEEVEEAGTYGNPMESRRLSDNVIVEIDEGMLRREIARMRALREEAVPSVDGEAPGAEEFDDFGDAEEQGEALEMDLSEMENQLEVEVDGKVESHPAGDGQFGPASQPNDQPTESIRRQMARELKLQENLQKAAKNAAKLYEAAKARFSKVRTLSERKETARKGSEHKAAYTNFAKRYNDSVKRFNQLSNALAEATRVTSTRSNNVAKPAASSGDSQLRNKLAETNLLNAKLMFTNKLLQSESLTSRQKSQVIAQLDEAKTLREVKLVYESLAKTLAAPRKTVTEGRVLGSSSQATRSAAPQTLNEGFEAERWAKLAGISK